MTINESTVFDLIDLVCATRFNTCNSIELDGQTTLSNNSYELYMNLFSV